MFVCLSACMAVCLWLTYDLRVWVKDLLVIRNTYDGFNNFEKTNTLIPLIGFDMVYSHYIRALVAVYRGFESEASDASIVISTFF